MVMQNFLMNLSGVAAIAGMLYGMLVMWRNIDKELAKMDAGKKKAECNKMAPCNKIASGNKVPARKKSGPVQDRSLYSHAIAVICKPSAAVSIPNSRL